MTEDKRNEITRLAKISYRATKRYNELGMRGSSPVADESESESLAVEFAIARAEMFEAAKWLREAIDS